MHHQINRVANHDRECGTERNVITARSIASVRAATRFSVTWAGERQVFLVASQPSPVDSVKAAAETYGRIAETLVKHRLGIVHERIFGSLSVEPYVMAERHSALLAQGIPSGNPVTYVQGRPPWGEGLAGVIIQAVSSEQVRTVMDGNRPRGRAWKRNGAEFLVIQNITGRNDGPEGQDHRSLQVRRMLDRAERILLEQGASYRDVARAWFYLSDILGWYAEFNKARNEKYGEFGIMPGPGDGGLLLPASTGIRGDTRSDAAATMDLIAVMGDGNSRPRVRQLTNHGQLDAFRYGSAFSRGALIQGPGVSLLHISGTAAIDERGKSLFADDIRGQIDCTLDKIASLMGQAGAGLNDMCAATVFVKRPEYADVFHEMAVKRGLEEFPGVCIVADVCRDELLFEIDAEAVIAND